MSKYHFYLFSLEDITRVATRSFLESGTGTFLGLGAFLCRCILSTRRAIYSDKHKAYKRFICADTYNNSDSNDPYRVDIPNTKNGGEDDAKGE
jgi:hypothetical protein